jgi:hypothetical protein
MPKRMIGTWLIMARTLDDVVIPTGRILMAWLFYPVAVNLLLYHPYQGRLFKI